MQFPEVRFPLDVDFGLTHYWIGDAGPFRHGEAVTALFTLELLPDAEDRGLSLIPEFAQYLAAFGPQLHPFSPGREPQLSIDLLTGNMQPSVQCSIKTLFRPVADNQAMVVVERYTFQCLRDFLYIELIRAIRAGNSPRQCRRCMRWFFHEQGEKNLYCDRPTSNDDPRTCRMVGAMEVFEKKIRDEKPWECYKRAYKKYYARMMKGNMSEAEFAEWRARGEHLRDEALEAYRAAASPSVMENILEELKKALNDR